MCLGLSAPAPPSTVVLFFSLFLFALSAGGPVAAWRPWPQTAQMNVTDYAFGDSKKYEGSSEFVKLRYHMGPVLTTDITFNLNLFLPAELCRQTPRLFMKSIGQITLADSCIRMSTDSAARHTSFVLKRKSLGEEKNDRLYSHGKSLTRLSIQSVIKSAITARTRPLPINPRSGLYLLLTADDVYVQDFCTSVCGFHYFTFPSLVGYTLPYAWVGNSAKLCPGQCAYPFAVPAYIPNLKPFKSPNGDVGVDGMISVIGPEMAELTTNPLANAWYAGQDPSFPVEIADLCEGIYGTGGGGSYTGQVLDARDGATYNMNGIRRRFLVQWLWSPVLNYCTGPNALDH
uniref:Protein EXORDIUM-like 3 n=1 Tax=Phaseolus vulgaris TaxID=3885 RepID=T2DN25_PHAVU|nr:hypothetical protein [Phaseolus vulgaris]